MVPAAPSSPASPSIRFSERRLENGLRVLVAPDHLAPVVAVNVGYNVGSRHEQPGRTGFAHLFEHFMFQGSRHVAKGEHFSIVQSAGGVKQRDDLLRLDEILRDGALEPARVGAVA